MCVPHLCGPWLREEKGRALSMGHARLKRIKGLLILVLQDHEDAEIVQRDCKER